MRSEFFVAKITLHKRNNFASTLELYLSNRQAESCTSEQFQYIPIIDQISGIGSEANEYIFKNTSGSIICDNSRESLAFQKRLSDLSVIYNLQGAEVEIYHTETALNDDCFLSDLELIWLGKIKTTEMTGGLTEISQRYTIQMEQSFKEALVTYKITDGAHPSAPKESLDQYVPLVIGELVHVKPIPISITGTSSQFLYGSMFKKPFGGSGTEFTYGGVQKVFWDDPNLSNEKAKKYSEVISGGSGSIIQGVGAVISNINTFEYIHCFPINYVSSSPQVLYGGTLEGILATGVGGANGELTIRLHAGRPNKVRPKAPDKFLAEAIVDKEDYPNAWQFGGAVPFTFDKPVPLAGSGTYWLSVTGSNEQAANSRTNIETRPLATGTPVGAQRFSTTNNTNNSSQKGWIKRGTNTIRFELNTLEFISASYLSTEDQGGISALQFLVNYFDAIDADYTNLDFVLEVDGLEDDASGSLTTTPNANINQPHFAINLLLHDYDPDEGWIPNKQIDFTQYFSSFEQYSSTAKPFFRRIDGAKTGRVNKWDVIEDICRNSFSKLAYDARSTTEPFSLLAVGEDRAAVETITDADGLIIERAFFNGQDTVVNRTDIRYFKQLNQTSYINDKSDSKEYIAALDYGYNDGGFASSLALNSFQHYGEMVLQNKDYDLLQNFQSAASVCKLILATHEHPYFYAICSVPAYKYKHLRMYNVINLFSSQLPNLSGTNPAHHADPDYYGLVGNLYNRVGTYRAEITAINFELKSNESGKMRLLARLIINKNDPLYKNILE